MDLGSQFCRDCAPRAVYRAVPIGARLDCGRSNCDGVQEFRAIVRSCSFPCLFLREPIGVSPTTHVPYRSRDPTTVRLGRGLDQERTQYEIRKRGRRSTVRFYPQVEQASKRGQDAGRFISSFEGDSSFPGTGYLYWPGKPGESNFVCFFRQLLTSSLDPVRYGAENRFGFVPLDP